MTASTTTDSAAVRARPTPDARTDWRMALAMTAPLL